VIGKTVTDLSPGDSAEHVHLVDDADIAEFVEAVGDYNPIHSDRNFAASTAFERPIAPGVYTAGLISAVIGTQLPGPGSIYLSQTLKFVKPVKAGDTITTRVEVLEVLVDRNRVRLGTVCTNQRGEPVLTGEAWVMPSRVAVHYERAAAPAASLALALQPWTWAAHALALWGLMGASILAASLERKAAKGHSSQRQPT
jgi:acyl dehydratase